MDRYCTHWGVANRVGTVEPRTCDPICSFTVTSRADVPETVLTREAVRAAFRAAWYAPGRRNAAFAKVGGKSRSRSSATHLHTCEEVPHRLRPRRDYQEPTTTPSYRTGATPDRDQVGAAGHEFARQGRVQAITAPGRDGDQVPHRVEDGP
jgi:hypothetical protein